MNYGKAIRILRAGAGLSKQDLAKRAGIDPSYLTLLENNRRNASSNTISQLARALNIHPGLIHFLAGDPIYIKEDSDYFINEFFRFLEEQP